MAWDNSLSHYQRVYVWLTSHASQCLSSWIRKRLWSVVQRKIHKPLKAIYQGDELSTLVASIFSLYVVNFYLKYVSFIKLLFNFIFLLTQEYVFCALKLVQLPLKRYLLKDLGNLGFWVPPLSFLDCDLGLFCTLFVYLLKYILIDFRA